MFGGNANGPLVHITVSVEEAEDLCRGHVLAKLKSQIQRAIETAKREFEQEHTNGPVWPKQTKWPNDWLNEEEKIGW